MTIGLFLLRDIDNARLPSQYALFTLGLRLLSLSVYRNTHDLASNWA